MKIFLTSRPIKSRHFLMHWMSVKLPDNFHGHAGFILKKCIFIMLYKLLIFHIFYCSYIFCWLSPLIDHTFLLITSPYWSYIFADYLPSLIIYFCWLSPLLIIHFCWLSPLIDHTFLPLISTHCSYNVCLYILNIILCTTGYK